MTDIFLSYAREDRNRIEPLAERLIAEGFDLWWDTRISSGAEFSREIESQLNAAAVVVVAWSRASVESLWVADEASVGLTKGNLLPIRLDDVEPRLGFRQIQTIDFNGSTPAADGPGITALLDALRQRLQRAGSSELKRRAVTEEFNPATLTITRAASTPFIGREPERRAITAQLEQALEGHGGIVMIGGEPGVGKTRLAEFAIDAAIDRGMLPLVGHAYEERGAPFIVATEVVEQLIRSVPAPQLRSILGDTATEIARLVPELRRIFPDLPRAAELPADQQQRYLFNAMLELMTRLSDKAPLIILLDDLHWADDSSIALLEHLAPHLPGLPIVMVITYRDVAADMGAPFRRAMISLNRQPFVSRIPLHRLSQDDVAALLASLGAPNPPEVLVERIFQETEGNTLFVQSVFQNLVDEGKLLDSAGDWRRDFSPDDISVPDSVRLVIEQRCERISDDCRQMLNVSAVIGLRFDPRVVEAASGLGDAVLDAIEEAEAAKLVLAAATGRDTRYEFSHALVRQTLLESLSPLRRQRLHQKVADALIALFADDRRRYADIAGHLYESGSGADVALTMHYLLQAAAYAQETAAFSEAVDHLDRVLDIAPDADTLETAQALAQRAAAKKALHDWFGAEKDWRAALPQLEAADLHEQVAEICWEVALISSWSNRFDDATAVIDRGLALAGDRVSSARCRLLAGLAHAHSTAGNYEESIAPLEQAEAMAESLGDRRVSLVEVLQARLYHCEHFMLASQYLESSEKGILAARESGSPWLISNALGISMHAYVWVADFERLDRNSDELQVFIEKSGNALALFGHHFGKGAVEYTRGNLADGEEHMRIVTTAMRAMGAYWTMAHTTVGQMLFLQGRWDEAEVVVEEARQSGVVGTWADTEAARCLKVYAYTGNPLAGELLEDLVASLPEAGRTNRVGAWFVLHEFIEATAVMNKPQQPDRCYSLALQLKQQGVVMTWSFGLLERFLGIAAMSAGKFDVAEQHFRTGLLQAESIPVVPEQGEIRRWWAIMLQRRGADGDRELARELLADAREVYRNCGMPKHDEMARDLLDAG
ncbi:MAG: AAA family ATPase [Gammaproteobacteria bacterium]